MAEGNFHVAIDGPVASGKGVTAAALSKRLGIPCLDTGAIYRGIAVYILENSKSGQKVFNESLAGRNATNKINGLPSSVALFRKHLLSTPIKISARIIGNVTHIYLDGADITGKLRENNISQLASKVATIPEVRKLCTKISQDIAKTQNLIAEGRDICSVVLPNAKYKFYLTADVGVRARRRYNELIDRGQHVAFDKVLAETQERDLRDSTKGGLVQTPDAVVVDSTDMSVDQTAEYMLKIIDERKEE